MPIDFCEAISDESEMSGFLLLAPKRFPATPLCCSGRHIYFLEAIPLYPSEVQGIRKFGPKPFLKASPDFADPRRPVVELA
jgi:hypothetical protein